MKTLSITATCSDDGKPCPRFNSSAVNRNGFSHHVSAIGIDTTDKAGNHVRILWTDIETLAKANGVNAG
jgi:hypothetical protein